MPQYCHKWKILNFRAGHASYSPDDGLQQKCDENDFPSVFNEFNAEL